MTTKTIHNLTHSFYFITVTCFKWLSLFETSKVYDYFPTWIDQMNKRGVPVSGYVIMPNRLHLLVFLHPQCNNLNTLIGNSKRFLAYEIVKRLKESGQKDILQILTNGVMPEEQNKGKLHQIFKPSFDAKLVEGEDQIISVLDYIHHNPVSKKWRLVSDLAYQTPSIM